MLMHAVSNMKYNLSMQLDDLSIHFKAYNPVSLHTICYYHLQLQCCTVCPNLKPNKCLRPGGLVP